MNNEKYKHNENKNLYVINQQSNKLVRLGKNNLTYKDISIGINSMNIVTNSRFIFWF